MDNFVEQIECDLNELQKKYRITWLNDQVRQETIDNINNSGKKKEGYRLLLKKAAREISKGHAHFYATNPNKGVNDKPTDAGKFMSIEFEIKTTGKKKYFEIFNFKINDYPISRKMLIPDIYYIKEN